MAKEEISKNILELSEEIQGKLSVSADGVIVAPADLFESTLDRCGLNMETVKKVQDHTTALFVPALIHAVGEKSIEACKENAQLDTTFVDVQVGNDRSSVQYQKVREVPDGNGGTKQMFGHVTSKYTVVGASGENNEMRKVLNSIASKAQAAFSS